MSETGSSASEITRTYWIITGHKRAVRTEARSWLKIVGNRNGGMAPLWTKDRSHALKFDSYYDAAEAYVSSASGIGHIVQVNVRKKPKTKIDAPKVTVEGADVLVNGLFVIKACDAAATMSRLKNALGVK